jgi:hypothetical protein
MGAINKLRELGRRRRRRAEREAQAVRATVYVARDGAGRLIGWR